MSHFVLTLNFLFFSLWKRRREVNLWHCSWSPWLLWIGRFLKLSECFMAVCSRRDSVGVHTCEESCWWARLASPQNPAYCKAPGPRLPVVAFLHPFSWSPDSSAHLSVGSLSVYPLPSLMGQMDKSAWSSVKRWPGSPVFLIYKRRLCEWQRATEKVPRRQKTCAFYIISHHEEELFYGWKIKKRGFSNNLSKVQKLIYNAQTIVYRGTLCVRKFVITGLFLPIFISVNALERWQCFFITLTKKTRPPFAHKVCKAWKSVDVF